MQKGVAAPTEGYFGDEDTARTTFEALKNTRLERDAWHDVVFAISGDVETVRRDAKTQLAELNRSVATARKAAGRKSTRNTVIGAVLGIVVGLIVGNN